jgi:restriction system protein
MSRAAVPRFDELLNPTLAVLRQLGGSASIEELDEGLTLYLALPADVAEAPHSDGRSTELEYRAAWARSYLKKVGLVDNSSRGVWSLTAAGLTTPTVNPQDVVAQVRAEYNTRRQARDSEPQDGDLDDADPEHIDVEQVRGEDWRDEALTAVLAMDPIAFERLCQRILRESGFTEVDVTARSGDGGIDGHGLIRIGGLISFNVLFQSKRNRDTVGPDVVRDFRGAMIGRADKGLIITTGRFTREARREATRDGAPPVDLIDGELLVEKLKELGLGVMTTRVERVEVDSGWFTTV